MAKKAVVLLAEGFEEVEAVTPIDYLRRAGIEVIMATVGESLTVKGARGIPVHVDITLAGLMKQGRAVISSLDAVILPGGMPGASNLAASKETGVLLKEMAADGKWICAICASPAVVLAPLGLLLGKQFTCYPGMESGVKGGKWSDDRVVIDGNIITSRAAGTAGRFAVVIIGKLLNGAEGKKVADAVLL
jgi:4-methyl-5(b-hydroxyethyl)-thiazole monophosphate biosynthesis